MADAAKSRTRTVVVPKLVMGHIEVITGDDMDVGIPYDEAVIHLEGDRDSEIEIRCPGALRLAPFIVKAVNNHDALVKATKNSADALDYCLSVLPKDELLRIKVEATVAAARKTLTQAGAA